MATYKARVGRDLDGWIANGLVPIGSRKAMLDAIPESGRADASTALALLGALLLGAAVIAFTAANWNGIPRLLRFTILLTGFLAAAGIAAWGARTKRVLVVNGLSTVSALVFAAAVGLTGQIFDIAGDPRTALLVSGFAAGTLALASGSSGPGIAALVLIGCADVMGDESDFALTIAAVVAAATAWRWRSEPMAHAAGFSFIIGAFVASSHQAGWSKFSTDWDWLLAAIFAASALSTRRKYLSSDPIAAILYGWLIAGALWFFVLAEFAPNAATREVKLLLRAVWLIVAGATIALGRHDRHALVTVCGVLALICGIAAVLFDLGFGLGAASATFAACAALALAGGWIIRTRQRS